MFFILIQALDQSHKQTLVDIEMPYIGEIKDICSQTGSISNYRNMDVKYTQVAKHANTVCSWEYTS